MLQVATLIVMLNNLGVVQIAWRYKTQGSLPAVFFYFQVITCHFARMLLNRQHAIETG